MNDVASVLLVAPEVRVEPEEGDRRGHHNQAQSQESNHPEYANSPDRHVSVSAEESKRTSPSTHLTLLAATPLTWSMIVFVTLI